MSVHRRPCSVRNSSLLLFCISIVGCQSPAPPAQAEKPVPTWSFKNITWRTFDSEKKLSLKAETLEHFGDRIRAENLHFSYQTSHQFVSGYAKQSKSSPELRFIEFKDLRVNAENFGIFESDSGTLDVDVSQLNLQSVDGTLIEPPLRLTTASATLTLDSEEEVVIETSAIKGKLKDPENP